MQVIKLVKEFAGKGNQIYSESFLPHINLLKIAGNHSVPELENALFFSLLLDKRGIYEEV